MAKSRKVRVLSFAKLQAVMFGLLGLVAGMLYSFGGLVIDVLVTIGWFSTPETPGLSYGTVLAFGALVGMPIIFAVFGFVLGLVEVVLYNLFAERFDRINIDFEKR